MTRNRTRRRTAKSGGMDTVQIAALVVIFVVVAGLAWMLLPKSQAPAAARSWSNPPPMTIDPSHKYKATVTMAKGGEFVIELYADKAPVAVNNFVFLAWQGYFNGVTFHRVLDGFMAQGGAPTGTGTGGPGYEFPNEDSELTFDKAGVVAMANAGREHEWKPVLCGIRAAAAAEPVMTPFLVRWFRAWMS